MSAKGHPDAKAPRARSPVECATSRLTRAARRPYALRMHPRTRLPALLSSYLLLLAACPGEGDETTADPSATAGPTTLPQTTGPDPSTTADPTTGPGPTSSGTSGSTTGSETTGEPPPPVECEPSPGFACGPAPASFCGGVAAFAAECGVGEPYAGIVQADCRAGEDRCGICWALDSYRQQLDASKCPDLLDRCRCAITAP